MGMNAKPGEGRTGSELFLCAEATQSPTAHSVTLASPQSLWPGKMRKTEDSAHGDLRPCPNSALPVSYSACPSLPMQRPLLPLLPWPFPRGIRFLSNQYGSDELQPSSGS